MNRRRFTLAALFPATLLTGCHSEREPKPSLDATLFHNEHVREAMDEVNQAMNGLEMRMGQFNAENWQDALTNTQTATIRLRNATEDLKRSLGYGDAG